MKKTDPMTIEGKLMTQKPRTEENPSVRLNSATDKDPRNPGAPGVPGANPAPNDLGQREPGPSELQTDPQLSESPGPQASAAGASPIYRVYA